MAETERKKTEIQPQVYANDNMIERDRTFRWILLIVVMLASIALPTLIARGIVSDFVPENTTIANIAITNGGFAGMAIGAMLSVYFLERSLIRNRTARAFVTINVLRTLLNHKRFPSSRMWESMKDEEKLNFIRDRPTFPTYGPGTHICYFFEKRIPSNNVSLEEASVNFTFEVQCQNGDIRGKGSCRLRPDIMSLIAFLSGVASVAQDLVGLIISRIVSELASKTVDEALANLAQLNTALNKEFRDEEHKSEEATQFEKRFGVNVGDVTVEELLPSDDVRKTKNALTEANSILNGTAMLLGFRNHEDLEAARAKGVVINDDRYDRARERFMAASGNLEGMTINRHEIDVKGISPEVVQALVGAAAIVGTVTKPKS